MNVWERLVLVFCVFYGALWHMSFCHQITDIIFRHVLHVNFFELELHKDPSEDSIAGM
jgi:hypothetical protein